MTQQNLVVCIVAPIDRYCFADVAQALDTSHCEILSSTMNTFDDRHVVTLYLSGNWGVLIKTESLLKRMAESNSWEMICQRAEPKENDRALLSYTVNCMSVDKADIPKHLGGFFTHKACHLLSYNSSRYQSTHSRIHMQSVNARILVPADSNLGTLREDFYTFCDDHNYEAVLDPDRN